MDTVGDVVKRLLEFPQDLPIMKSKDEEGNGFTSIWCVQVEKYLADVGRNRYNLEIINQEDIDAGEYGDEPNVGEVVIIWG